MVTLGTQIKVLRTIRDMSQGELAEAVGIRQPTLSEFENGKTLPCEDTLQRIKTILRWPEEGQAGIAFTILAGG